MCLLWGRARVVERVLCMVLELTRLRLRWYALATRRVLMRHWQIFIIAGLFVPLGTPIGKLVLAMAYPLIAMLSRGRDPAWYVWRLAMIQGLAWAWVMVQRRNIAGGDFMRYAHALPVSRGMLRSVDLAILLLVDSLLLVPFFAVLMVASFTAAWMPHGGDLLASSGVLLALGLLIQLALLEGRLVRMLPFLMVADFTLGWALSMPPSWLASLAIGASLLVPMLFLLAMPPAAGPPWPRGKQEYVSGSTRWLHPAWRTQLQALWVQQRGGTSLRLGAALVVALASDGLMRVFAFDARALPAAILAMGWVAFILGGTYRALHGIHRPMQAYLRSLPLPRRYWALQDIALVLALGSLPLVVLLLPVLTQTETSNLTVGVLTLTYWGLLAMMRLVFVYGGRQAVLLGVMLAGAWIGCAIAVVR